VVHLRRPPQGLRHDRLQRIRDLEARPELSKQAEPEAALHRGLVSEHVELAQERRTHSLILPRRLHQPQHPVPRMRLPRERLHLLLQLLHHRFHAQRDRRLDQRHARRDRAGLPARLHRHQPGGIPLLLDPLYCTHGWCPRYE